MYSSFTIATFRELLRKDALKVIVCSLSFYFFMGGKSKEKDAFKSGARHKSCKYHAIIKFRTKEKSTAVIKVGGFD